MYVVENSLFNCELYLFDNEQWARNYTANANGSYGDSYTYRLVVDETDLADIRRRMSEYDTMCSEIYEDK